MSNQFERRPHQPILLVDRNALINQWEREVIRVFGEDDINRYFAQERFEIRSPNPVPEKETWLR